MFIKVEVDFDDLDGTYEDAWFGVSLTYVTEYGKLKWYIGDCDAYSFEFYEKLLDAMKNDTPYDESAGGNSGSSISYANNELTMKVNCSGSGGDQDAEFSVNKEQGIYLVEKILASRETPEYAEWPGSKKP